MGMMLATSGRGRQHGAGNIGARPVTGSTTQGRVARDRAGGAGPDRRWERQRWSVMAWRAEAAVD
jgi:hypothetical protein